MTTRSVGMIRGIDIVFRLLDSSAIRGLAVTRLMVAAECQIRVRTTNHSGVQIAGVGSYEFIYDGFHSLLGYVKVDDDR